MKAGIEVSIVTDTTTGKRGLRIYPYFEATDKQKAYIASAITIGLFVGSIILLSCAVPDPIIQPTVNIYPLP